MIIEVEAIISEQAIGGRLNIERKEAKIPKNIDDKRVTESQ